MAQTTGGTYRYTGTTISIDKKEIGKDLAPEPSIPSATPKYSGSIDFLPGFKFNISNLEITQYPASLSGTFTEPKSGYHDFVFSTPPTLKAVATGQVVRPTTGESTRWTVTAMINVVGFADPDNCKEVSTYVSASAPESGTFSLQQNSCGWYRSVVQHVSENSFSMPMRLQININTGSSATNILYVTLRMKYEMEAAAMPGDQTQAEPGKPPSAPAASDSVFVSVPGPGFDGSCVYNDRNPYSYSLNVTRVVGEVDEQGYLMASKQAVDNGLLSRYAKLRIAVWDVDEKPPSSVEPESDFISFNGFELGPGDSAVKLTGGNQIWKINEYRVPIALVKFARRGERGSPPVPGLNTIRITVDVGNQVAGRKSFCVALGWISLDFDAMAPLMLVHGTNAQSPTWELNIVKNSPVGYLRDLGAVFEYRIDMLKNGSARENGTMLYNMLAGEAVRHGVQGLHLITHSKGATDSRYMLSNLYNTGPAPTPFKVLSLFSIGTPSEGTILSDYSMAAGVVSQVQLGAASPSPLPPEAVAGLVDASNANFLAMVGQAPEDPARALQTHAGMAAFNAQANPLKPLDVPYFSIAGNADASGDHHIKWQEAEGMLPGPESFLAWAGERMYQALGLTAEIRLVKVDLADPAYKGTATLAEVKMREVPEPNDLVSLVSSTHCASCGFIPLGTFPYNHSALKSPDVLKAILDRIRGLYPIRER